MGLCNCVTPGTIAHINLLLNAKKRADYGALFLIRSE